MNSLPVTAAFAMFYPRKLPRQTLLPKIISNGGGMTKKHNNGTFKKGISIV